MAVTALSFRCFALGCVLLAGAGCHAPSLASLGPSPARSSAVSAERAAIAAGLQLLSLRWSDDAPVCLATRDSAGRLRPPDPAFVEELSGQRRVVAYAECPPLLSTPHRVVIGRISYGRSGEARWALEHSRGRTVGLYNCEAAMPLTDPPAVTCSLQPMQAADE